MILQVDSVVTSGLNWGKTSLPVASSAVFTFLLGKVLAAGTFNQLLQLRLAEVQAVTHFKGAAQPSQTPGKSLASGLIPQQPHTWLSCNYLSSLCNWCAASRSITQSEWTETQRHVQCWENIVARFSGLYTFFKERPKLGGLIWVISVKGHLRWFTGLYFLHCGLIGNLAAVPQSHYHSGSFASSYNTFVCVPRVWTMWLVSRWCSVTTTLRRQLHGDSSPTRRRQSQYWSSTGRKANRPKRSFPFCLPAPQIWEKPVLKPKPLSGGSRQRAKCVILLLA